MHSNSAASTPGDDDAGTFTGTARARKSSATPTHSRRASGALGNGPGSGWEGWAVVVVDIQTDFYTGNPASERAVECH